MYKSSGILGTLSFLISREFIEIASSEVSSDLKGEAKQFETLLLRICFSDEKAMVFLLEELSYMTALSERALKISMILCSKLVLYMGILLKHWQYRGQDSQTIMLLHQNHVAVDGY